MYHFRRMTDLAWADFRAALHRNPNWLDVDTDLLYRENYASMEHQINGSLAYINEHNLRIVSVGYDVDGNPKNFLLEVPPGWKLPLFGPLDARIEGLRVVL